MAEYEKKVREILKENGCYFVRHGKLINWRISFVSAQNKLWRVLIFRRPENMSYEKMSACADLILADAIEDLAREENKPKAEIRKKLMTSKAYECLYDFDSGLWQEGPAYFIDFYRRIEGLK